MIENPSQTLLVLADNLERLRAWHPVLNSQSAIARAAKVDQKTVGRILLKQHEPRVDVVAKLAEAFGLELWQLLVPHLQPGVPPLLQEMQRARAPSSKQELSEGTTSRKGLRKA